MKSNSLLALTWKERAAISGGVLMLLGYVWLVLYGCQYAKAHRQPAPLQNTSQSAPMSPSAP